MKTLKRKVYGLISICEEHGLNEPNKFQPSLIGRGRPKRVAIAHKEAGNAQQQALARTTKCAEPVVCGIKWSEEMAATSVEATDCARLLETMR
jgi:hypothetical protein